MDAWGDIAIIKSERELIGVLARGYRRVYMRGPVQGPYRLSFYRYVSPFPLSRAGDSFCHREYGLTIAGPLGLFYYNPRYAQERKQLSALLRCRDRAPNLRIRGGGVGVYGFYLRDCYDKIACHDTNPACQRYGRFNAMLNRIEGILFYTCDQDSRVSSPQDDFISMIPSLPFEQNLQYEFKKNLVFYTLLPLESVDACRRRAEEAYGLAFTTTLVRPFAASLGVFRFLCTRS